jgi:hypothetical protein
MNLNQIYKIVLTNNSYKNNILIYFNKVKFKYKIRQTIQSNNKIFNKIK